MRAKDAKAWVGGQPTLTHFFFRLIDDRFFEADKSLEDIFKMAGYFLREHPPHLVARWRELLLELVQNQVMRQRLEQYTAGATRALGDETFDNIDVYLFLAGWMGKNEERRWSIRSKCHRTWAGDALRRL